MADELAMWTIYDHPLDYPDSYVVRLWRITASGPEVATEAWVADTLEGARRLVPPGLHRLERAPDDDSVIVETWL